MKGNMLVFLKTIINKTPPVAVFSSYIKVIFNALTLKEGLIRGGNYL